MMKHPSVPIERHVLRSKVAFRIFTLFVVCSLLPISALATFALSRVSGQLREQADQRMRQSCKSAGLVLFQRMQELEADLTMIAAYLRRDPGRGLEFVTRELRGRLRDRFADLAIVKNEAGAGLAGRGAGALSAAEIDHLQAGHALVLIDQNGAGSRIWMVRARDPRDLSKGFLDARIAPGYLLEDDGFVAGAQGLAVLDADGSPLYVRGPWDPGQQQRVLGLAAKAPSGNCEWSDGEGRYVSRYRTLYMWPQYRAKWLIVRSESLEEVIAPAAGFRSVFSRITILLVSLALLLSLIQIRRRLGPLVSLRQATERIAVNDYGVRLRIDSRDEFGTLAGSFNSLAAKMESQIQSMATLNRIGVLLSSERNAARLAEIILAGAKELTGAEAGALYLVGEGGEIRMASLDADVACPGRGPVSVLDGMSIGAAARAERNLVAHSARTGRGVNIPDLEGDERFDLTGNPYFDPPSDYRPRSVLCVPLIDHEHEIIGVLQLVNARERHTARVVPFDGESEKLTRSLASQAAVAITKSSLIEGYKHLFDALAELIGRAIDEKSPYTGDHCRRVPILTMMLADAACATREGPLASFDLTEEERYELQVASLLHDCGKVATPVHVVDKATKLETICDRIDLIETRFEIIRRDIAGARDGRGDGADGPVTREADVCRDLHRLEDDRRFLRRCNIGSESMSRDDQERIRAIAERYSWFDREGIARRLLNDDEIRHLSISRGTLTAEEREIINHHVVATIKMLEALPYPKALRNVPRIVGAHHERMDGNGYPRGLTRDEILVQGRILGIADVFEALTARDRPYKKAKKLSEALQILSTMAATGHIDPDLFDVFIREKVYLRYASAYLAPEQIDVDEDVGISDPIAANAVTV